MKKYPNAIYAEWLQEWDMQAEINGKWVMARPIRYPTLAERVHLAWLVFIGRADALIWPEQQ